MARNRSKIDKRQRNKAGSIKSTFGNDATDRPKLDNKIKWRAIAARPKNVSVEMQESRNGGDLCNGFAQRSSEVCVLAKCKDLVGVNRVWCKINRMNRKYSEHC